jgi:hypothetical protein
MLSSPTSRQVWLLLASFFLAGCHSLTGEAWTRGLCDPQYRGSSQLTVEEVLACDSGDGLLLRYTARDTGVDAYRGHLPPRGWLTLRILGGDAAVWRDALLRLADAGSPHPPVTLDKVQRGVKIRWQAHAMCQPPGAPPRRVGFTVMATAARPAECARQLRVGFPDEIEFRYFKRRSRAQLLTETILLTPPLLIADLGINIGKSLAEAEWDIDLIGLLLHDDDDDGWLSGRRRSKAKKSSRRHTGSGNRRTSVRRPSGPTGSPQRNPRRGT